ncbi:MAG: thioesterase family protein [Bacteroidales bacterium]|nr:thioesterase family protein [Bacteroidales bacterium]
MEITIPINIKGHKDYKIQECDTAIAMGSGDVRVLATPKLLALMEEVSSNSIRKYLPEGYTSVGVEMHIHHLKSSKIGEQISIDSDFLKQEERKLYFHVIVTSKGEKIGEGDCNRFIVNKTKFENK